MVYSKMLSISTMQQSSTSLLSDRIPLFLVNEFEDVIMDATKMMKVRITPSKMNFVGAFEGKKYHQKLTIQNCGQESVFIRICPASSYAFEIKAMVRGQRLSPGLSIVRYVSYTYMRATSVRYATMPIYINVYQVDYKFTVVLSEVMISAIPQSIDYGTIDAGHSAAVRMLSLRNDGSKGTRFAIDLGRNDIELIVEPSKGVIQPHDTVTFRVECLGAREGAFSREFWIKCETPLRIGVKGTIIIPQLIPFHMNTTRDFTLVDFPKTYFGTYSIRSLVIRNLSATSAVYCTLAELTDKCVDIDEGPKYNPAYLDFKISPMEGSLLPHEGVIYQFTYKPLKKTAEQRQKPGLNYSFCCVRIVRVPCMDLHQVPGNKETVSPAFDDYLFAQSNEDASSLASGLLSFSEELSFTEYQRDLFHKETPIVLKRMVRILLYGEVEQANITIRPDSLDLQNICINKPETRELLLTNQSSSLPIVFNYRKACFIRVEPNSGLLPPSGSIEVGVTVTATNIGMVKTKIAFDLLYFNRPREEQDYVLVGNAEIPIVFNVLASAPHFKQIFNMGITPKYIKEVGFNTDDIRFNTPLQMPRATLLKEVKKKLEKNDNDLIAFPNDRPKSLRPWKSTAQCRTICAGILRAVSSLPDTYELSKSKADLKRKEHMYYKEYIKKDKEGFRKLQHSYDRIMPSYGISTKHDVLLKSAVPKCSIKVEDEKRKIPSFIPLRPLQLNKIKVTPSYIKLGKVAPNSTLTRQITVRNENNFSIRFFAKSRKPIIDFPDGEHRIVKPFKEVPIKFNYNSDSTVGRHNVVMDFIVNDNHTFTVAMNIDVVPKRVKFDREDVIFESNQCPFIYLDVYNPLNVSVSFSWQVPDSSFLFEPVTAVIPAHRHLTCLASYIPNHATPSAMEVTLCSEYGRNQTLNVTANLIQPNVAFKNSVIKFDDIPLNLPSRCTIVLKNLGFEPVTFAVLNPEPMRGISITPTEGVFEGYSEQIFTINVKIPVCIAFNCDVDIEVQRIKIMRFKISGNVIYPNIVIAPETVQLRKIAPNSFERQFFVVLNKSDAKATVEFRLNDYIEYTILDTQDFDIRLASIGKIELEPHEEKELYIHFNPMGAATYCFYLPMIINDLLGPVFLNMPETRKPITFTASHEKLFKEEKNVKYITMPKLLPLVTVSSGVGGYLLRFSKLHLHFKYCPYEYFNSETEHEIRISNLSKDICNFCIRTDEISFPFSLEHVGGSEIKILSYSMVCSLAPDEELILKATFNPSCPGSYYIKLPVYVRNYLQGSIFNYMSFTGWFPPPTITPTQRIVCLEPVPLRCESECSVFLKNEYHSKQCKLLIDSSISEVNISISEEPIYTDEKDIYKKLLVLIKCSLTQAKQFEILVKFTCTCGAECSVTVKGCSENCVVTTHAYVRVYSTILYSQALNTTAARSSFALANFKEAPKYGRSHDLSMLFFDTVSSVPSAMNILEELDVNYQSTFPIFPFDHQHTDHAKHMNNTVLAVEEWLFHQCFYCKCYYKIPEGIATLPTEHEKLGRPVPRQSLKQDIIVLKYVEILMNLVGSRVANYIPIRQIPGESIHRINYMYNVYSSAKCFLIKQGAYLPHVLPEYLLTYDDYEIFMKSILPHRPEYNETYNSEILDEQTFYYLSKQSWLDILLQTYKVFVLFRIRISLESTEIGTNESRISTNSSPSSISSNDSETWVLSQSCPLERDTKNNNKNNNKNNSKKRLSSLTSAVSNAPLPSKKLNVNKFYETIADYKAADRLDFWRDLSLTVPRPPHIYSESENILLHWLQYNFNKYRTILWGPEGLNPREDCPEPRTIQYFDHDLSDGLVLIAITCVHCPYLIPHLTDIYLNPSSPEQAFHNVSKLLKSWNVIKLSFLLNPKHVVNPNALQMLMLVNYLYEILPYFYPETTLYFKTGLSQSCIETVIVENKSDYFETYNIIFVGNERRFFSVSNTTVSIPPHQKTKINVKYEARNVALEDVTMILNGETPKHIYAKSMAFNLVGEPIPSYSTTTIVIPAPLYDLVDISLQIKSPYDGPCFYDVHFATAEPDDIRTCVITSWAEETRRKVPKRIISHATRILFNEKGIGIVDITICCTTTKTRRCWIIFKNSEVGDFTIKVDTIPEIHLKMDIPLTVELPEQYKSFRCSCRGSDDYKTYCPRTLRISVPCRNAFLWDSVKKLMIKIVDEGDLPFWRNYLGTNAGIQINKWMVEEPMNRTSYDIQKLFNNRVKYRIVVQGDTHPSDVSLPESSTIENVHSSGYHEIPVHIADNSQIPIPPIRFMMESEDKLEVRYYYVRFLTQKEYDNEMQLLVNV